MTATLNKLAAGDLTEVEKKERLLKEERESGVHSSQQKIKVVGLNS